MSNLVSIREISEPIIGGYWGEENEFPNSRVIRNGDITEDGKIRASVPARKLSEKEILKSRVKIDDILITISGNVGRVALVKSETDDKSLPFVSSNFVKILRINNTNFNPKFIFYFLRSKYFKQKLLKHVRGVAIQNLSTKIFDEKIVPVMSLEEQNKFVLLVQEIEDLKNKRIEANQKMKDVISGLFVKMFGDPESKNNKFPIVELSSVTNYITDGTHQPPKFIDSGIPFLFVKNIVSGEIDFNTEKHISVETYKELTKKYKPKQGNILYSTVGSYGVAVEIKEDREFSFQRHIGHISPDTSKINATFLCTQLNTPFVKRQADLRARGVAQKTVNLQEIKKFRIVVPPLELQNKFTLLVNEICIQKDKQKQSTQMIDELFNVVMAKSFA